MQKMYAARKSRSFATFMAIIRQLVFLPDQWVRRFVKSEA
jgi:hypothetical protein